MINKLYLLLFVFFIQQCCIAQYEKAKELISHQLQIGDSLYFGYEEEKAEKCYIKVDSIYHHIFEKAKQEEDYTHIKGIGLAYANYMRRYRYQHLETIQIGNDVLQAASKSADTLAMVDAYNEISASNIRLEKTIEALKNLDIGLSLLDKERYPARAWEFYLLKATALKTIDRVKALHNIRNATKYLRPETPDANKAQNYKLYTLLLDESQLDSIEYYATLQYKYMEKKNTYELVTYVNQLAYRYIKQDQIEKARKLIDEKLAWCQFSEGFDICPDPGIIHTIGLVYKRNGDYKQAIPYFEFSHKSLLAYKDYTALLEVATDLADTYRKLGNYKKSTEILVPIKSYMDSVAIVKLKKEIEKIEIRRTLRDKEEEIGELKEENLANTLTISKITLYSYLLAFGLLLVVGIAVYRINRARVKVHKLNEKITQNRLHNLTSVMNPHFLFNCFSTLQYMILNNESLKANEYMTELSGLIRNILSASDSIYIPFDKELMILKAYINLENERLSDKFEVSYEIDPALQELEFCIPSMVVQPYIENAIKHGFSEPGKAYTLRIVFEQRTKNFLQCRVIDNGIGRRKAGELKKHHIEQHLSIATGNVEERLNLISTLQSYKTLVSIIDLEDDNGNPTGTEVKVTLPIVNDIQNQEKYA